MFKEKFLHLNKRISSVHFNLNQKKSQWMVFQVIRVLLTLAVISAACNQPVGVQTVPQTAAQVSPAGLSAKSDQSLPTPEAFTITTTPLASLARTNTPPAEPAFNLPSAPSSTPDPYADFTIDYLTQRNYGGGEIQVKDVLASNSIFTRTLITYPSDGLTIYGFIDTPNRGKPPFPVVIALHGYIDPQNYATLDYTTRYADAMARAGFLVLHPNLRGFPPSDNGEDLFRVGMATDVLNLIALVKEQAGKPGLLQFADASKIGLWGHSMGGGVATRVMTVSPDVRAVVLYGAMSGDELKNYTRIFNVFSPGTRGQAERAAPPEAFLHISPIYYLDRIGAAVSIHHGEIDTTVPPAWSQDLCDRLYSLGKIVECFTYPGEPHTFSGEGDSLFIDRMVQFLDQRLIER